MLRFAVRNLLSRPLRSVLALLGLTVAIMGMVGLFSVKAGIDHMVGQTFGRIPGIAAMQPGAPIPLFSRLPESWAAEIAQIPGVRVVRSELWVRAQIVAGKMAFNPPRFLFGTDIDRTLALKEAIYRDDMIAGRFLNLSDRGTRNCVISKPIAEEARKSVGDLLRVDGNDFHIVGIYECKSMLLDVAIVLDQQTVRKLTRFEDGVISSAYIEPDDTEHMEALMQTIRDHFRGRSLTAWQPASAQGTGVLNGDSAADVLWRIIVKLFEPEGWKPAEEPAATDTSTVPAGEAAIEIRSAKDWGERIADFSADLDLFLWLMTGIGVLIALLSILNTMLMSVSERLIEFGVLKANGWSSWNVLTLIVWESAVLGAFGGVLGCLLGWAGTLGMNWYFPTKLNLYASPELLTFSLCFSTALGIAGGLYPALWAVRMNPMDAIRRG